MSLGGFVLQSGRQAWSGSLAAGWELNFCAPWTLQQRLPTPRGLALSLLIPQHQRFLNSQGPFKKELVVTREGQAPAPDGVCLLVSGIPLALGGLQGSLPPAALWPALLQGGC